MSAVISVAGLVTSVADPVTSVVDRDRADVGAARALGRMGSARVDRADRAGAVVVTYASHC